MGSGLKHFNVRCSTHLYFAMQFLLLLNWHGKRGLNSRKGERCLLLHSTPCRNANFPCREWSQISLSTRRMLLRDPQSERVGITSAATTPQAFKTKKIKKSWMPANSCGHDELGFGQAQVSGSLGSTYHRPPLSFPQLLAGIHLAFPTLAPHESLPS